MYNIEKYEEGNLGHISLNLFRRKLKKDEKFRKKVALYQNLDIVMRGAMLATDAELEMIEKKIDRIAVELINNYYRKKMKRKNVKEFLNWS